MAKKLVMYRQRTSLPTPPGGGGGATLWSRFSYVGSVLTPASPTAQTFAFMRDSLAYDPTDDTFLIGAHDTNHPRGIARLSIPAPVAHAQDGTTTGLPTCTLLAGPVDITDGQGTTHPDGDVPFRVGNIALLDGKIWWVQEPNYHATPSTHPVLGHSDNTTNLTLLNGVAPWETNVHYKQLCRCVTVIPQAWADTNVGGRRFLMGCAGVSGDTDASHGPVAIAVQQPTTPGQTLTTQALSFHPEADKWIWPDTAREWHNGHKQFSMQWIEDGVDNWVVMTGTRYLTNYGYKHSTFCEPGGEGNGGFDGDERRWWLMTFHADDLLTADPQPREVVTITAPTFIRADECLPENPIVTAWDSVRKRLWIMEPKGDDQPFDDRPVLHAFDLAA